VTDGVDAGAGAVENPRMPTPDQIRATVESYVKMMTAGDAEGIAALYADGATLEDPIGAPLQSGREAILKWYGASAGKVRLSLEGPIRVAGGEAAFAMVGTVGTPDQPMYIDIIDVMKFDAAGKIVSMRAFWSADAIRR
jgi:steroid delta-isomerase